MQNLLSTANISTIYMFYLLLIAVQCKFNFAYNRAFFNLPEFYKDCKKNIQEDNSVVRFL